MAASTGKVHAIIHGASVTAAGVGAGLAQLPGSDAPILMTIQTGMIIALANAYGTSITRARAAELVLPLSATVAGRTTCSLLLGWVPGLGNALNAATAAALTEAIGWAAVAYFGDEA